ncbi:unnamed protein product [Closterium sp. NIES-64]|nr:unnamed protein product [Closterium sp. NIES-64]
MALRGHCSPQCPLPPLPPSSSQSLFPTTALQCVRARALQCSMASLLSDSSRLPSPSSIAVSLPPRRRTHTAYSSAWRRAPFSDCCVSPCAPPRGPFVHPARLRLTRAAGLPAEWAEGLAAAGTTLRAAGLSEAESTRRFIAVQRAYDVLSNPQQRARYDWELLHPAGGGRTAWGLGHEDGDAVAARDAAAVDGAGDVGRRGGAAGGEGGVAAAVALTAGRAQTLPHTALAGAQ